MLGRNILLSLLLIVSIPLQAWETDIALGVSVGYARDLGLYTIDVVYSGLPAFPYIYSDDAEYDSGRITGLLAGVEGRQSDWLVGIELRFNDFSMDHHRYFNFVDFPGSSVARVWSVDGKVKHGRDIGLLLRVGYAMTPYLLPYMYLGAEASHDFMELIIGAPNIYPRQLTLEDRRWVYRLTGGVGIECPVPWTEALSTRLEYMFHLPQTTLQAKGMMQDGVLNPLFSAAIRPRTQSIAGAIVWNI